MFSRNVLTAVEFGYSCKPLLLERIRVPFGNVSYQVRSSLHSSRRSARRPRLQPEPIDFHVQTGPLYAKSLVRPFFFTLGVSVASLTACCIWEYENLRAHAITLFKKPSAWLGNTHKKLTSQYRSEPGPIKKWWNTLNNSEKVFYPILAANVLVFGMWRVRSLQPFMLKYFCSNPSGSAVCWPMVLSTFSHHSPLHLAANMYVLYSFMPEKYYAFFMEGCLTFVKSFVITAVASLGKEQFVALYMSAGVVSSFASFLYKVMMNQPGLSLGASGAIMAILSYVCVQYPDTRLSIIFLPMYTFAAGSAIKVIMSMDLAGVVFGWKFFDHAAHLGGALFGLAWCNWGEHVWGNRDKFLQYYHTLRKDTGR